MTRLLLLMAVVCVSGCDAYYERKAAEICQSHGGIMGYQTRYGFPIVVCNDWHKEIVE